MVIYCSKENYFISYFSNNHIFLNINCKSIV